MAVKQVKYGEDKGKDPLYHIYINQSDAPGDDGELRYLESSDDVRELNQDADYIRFKLPPLDTFHGDYGYRLNVPDYDTRRMREPVNKPQEKSECDDMPF